jgi:putative addiction module antidote
MLKAKVTTVGNSAGIVLPKEALGKLKVHKGDFVYLIETLHGYEVVSYDEKFVQQMKVAQKIMHEDRNVLKALAECHSQEEKPPQTNKVDK